MLKIMEDDFLMGLMSIKESSTTQLAFIINGIAINRSSTYESRAIKGVDNNGNKGDDISIVDNNRTG